MAPCGKSSGPGACFGYQKALNRPKKPNQGYPGNPPTVLLASALVVEGKAVIQISRPEPVSVFENGKVKPGIVLFLGILIPFNYANRITS